MGIIVEDQEKYMNFVSGGTAHPILIIFTVHNNHKCNKC